MKKSGIDSRALALRASAGRGLRAVALGVVIAGMGAGAAHAVTLEDAVRTAVATNPDVGVVATDRRAIDQEVRQARALYLPSVDARFATGLEFTERRAGGLPGRDHTRLTRQESSLTLTQLLFDGFGVAAEVQRQKARAESAARRVVETSEFIGLDAIQAYLDVLRQQELVALAEDNVARHERFLEDMQQRLQGGTGSVADVRQAESRLARAQTTLVETKQTLEDSSANYIRVVGEAPENLSRPTGVADLLPQTQEMAVAEALNTNPTVAIANADIKVAQAELRASRQDFYPDINLELTAQRDRNISAVKGTTQEYRAMVVATWNLFRGGQTVAENQEAVERLAEAREVLAQAQRSAEEEARLSWNALQSARDRIVQLEDQVAANVNVRDAYEQQFNLGQRSLLDLLDTENELFVSRGDLVTAEFVELFAQYRLLADAGRLLENLGVTPPAEGMVAGGEVVDYQELAAEEAEAEAEADLAKAEEVLPSEGELGEAVDETSMETGAADEAMVEPAGGPTAETAATEQAMAAEDTGAAAEPAAAPAAEGQVSDDTLLSLNFNPLWETE